MPKKSKKSKSKRTTLRQKYKVIRKVKEHHKKKAKEAKKAGASGRKKVEKDPGIPSQYPFKEQLLKEIEFAKARALAEAAQKKEQRKLNKVEPADPIQMHSLQEECHFLSTASILCGWPAD